MDSDQLATEIGGILETARVKWRLHAAGLLDKEKKLHYTTITVEAYDPKRSTYVQIDTLEGAEKFVRELPGKDA